MSDESILQIQVDRMRKLADLGTRLHGSVFSFDYVNYRGEASTRQVRGMLLWYGSTKTHPRDQWLFDAIDLDKGEVRSFAVDDIQLKEQ